jgi:hypothetical protein
VSRFIQYVLPSLLCITCHLPGTALDAEEDDVDELGLLEVAGMGLLEVAGAALELACASR